MMTKDEKYKKSERDPYIADEIGWKPGALLRAKDRATDLSFYAIYLGVGYSSK